MYLFIFVYVVYVDKFINLIFNALVRSLDLVKVYFYLDEEALTEVLLDLLRGSKAFEFPGDHDSHFGT